MYLTEQSIKIIK